MELKKLIIESLIKEMRGELPPKKVPKNIKTILDQINLFEMYPKIYALVIKDDKLRSRVFLRYQEFYESDSDTFRGQGFKWKDYVDYYKAKTKKDYFSYHEDWSGFNIPCTSLESCIQKIPDLNLYDMIMFSVVDTIRKIVGSEDFYLIGIDQSTNEDPSLIHHEIAHGLYFSNPMYRAKMNKAIEQMEPHIREQLSKKISNMGYGSNVIDDEIQAYLSTGLIEGMPRIKNIKKEVVKFKNIFDKYSGKISPKKIMIDWSTDLDK
jgi:hypothetical protein